LGDTGLEPGIGPEHLSDCIDNALSRIGSDAGIGGSAESGALGADSGDSLVDSDTDLRAVVAAWATLPAAVKAGVVALIAAAGRAE